MTVTMIIMMIMIMIFIIIMIIIVLIVVVITVNYNDNYSINGSCNLLSVFYSVSVLRLWRVSSLHFFTDILAVVIPLKPYYFYTSTVHHRILL